MIGKRIKELRKRNNLTQEELGAIIGRERSAIARYELGLVNIPSSIIAILAKKFKIPADYFFNGKRNR